MTPARKAKLSAPPPADCRIFHAGKTVHVSRVAVEGVRAMQKYRTPDLDLVLIAERSATRWLVLMMCEYRARARRRAVAR
jgi:hypothetical protein